MEGLICKKEPVYKITRVKIIKREVTKVKAPYKEFRDPHSATKLRSMS